MAQAVAQDHQVQTAVDKLFKAATEPLDKDSQAELVVDLIVKAIINMPVVAEAVQADQAKMPVMKDMNIMHQTVALEWHQTCWETYIILLVAAAAGHTICLLEVAQVALVAAAAEHAITEHR